MNVAMRLAAIPALQAFGMVPPVNVFTGKYLRQAFAEEQLLADLGSVITSGADDWTLFDIQYWEDGGGIEVIDALDLDAPLTLTPDEGFALMVALNALAAVPGGADSDELASVTAKLAAALGRHAPAPGVLAVRVDLPEEVVGPVEAGAGRGAGRGADLPRRGPR